ncbi:MAG: c-type cytochrome [Candidatus Scalindua sp.]
MKEEEKSYVGLYVLLSFILAVTNVWALWNEVAGKRPWKEYQAHFYELEYDNAKKKYDDAVLAFEQQEEQDKYKAIERKLDKAKKEFGKPQIQAEYKKALDELRALDKDELAPLRFESIVIRNKMLEEEYLYGKYKYLHGRRKREGSRRNVLKLDDKSKKLAEKIKRIEGKRTELQVKLDGYKSNIIKYTEELELHSSNMLKYKEGMEKLEARRPQLQVYQVRLEELNEVDRCMSCHVGINKRESISEEQPYARHPRREVYLGNHPPEKFGCVLCHDGQARATTSAKKAHGEVEYWLEPMLKGKMAQSSCIKCHDKDEELVGGEDIWKGIKLFEELACYGCHKTGGFDKDKNRMIGPDLIEISSKVNPGWLVSWLKGPKHFRPSTRMPDFKLSEDDAMAITSYLWQNSEGYEPDEPEEFDEETVEEGAFIFESVGCLACHSDIEEDGMIHGPNLARIGEKINYEYLVSWLLKPKKHQPRTRMPDLRLDEEDAKYVAAFLKSLKSGYLEVLSSEEWLTDEKTASRGKDLINRYGCFGCHKIQGMEGKTKIGVELSEIGSKHIHLFDFGSLEKELLHGVGLESSHENIGEARRAWLRAKLTDPRQFDEGRYKRPEDKLRMPNFNLSEDEIKSLLILLTGMREGELPESYIAKLEGEKKSLVKGKRVIDKFNCMGCHQFSIDTLILKSGVVAKGMVKLEEEENLYFQLWEDNEGLGRNAGETVQIANEDIKSMSRSKGGDIGEFIIDYHVEVEGRVAEEAKVFTPPVLYGEGKKVQSAWLFEFLEEPVALRPWLDVRMPTFKMTEDEATILTGYFAALEKEEYPYEYIVETKEKYLEEKENEKPGYLTMAEHLFKSKNVNCASCHVRGDITPEGEPADWAPDLSRARERLKPDWIVDWLLDPQLIQPGTKMPKFFREGVFQDIFPGTPEEQVVALKDLLMNLPEEMLKQQTDESEPEEEEE